MKTLQWGILGLDLIAEEFGAVKIYAQKYLQTPAE